MKRVLLIAAAVLLFAAPAHAFTGRSGVATMDDGVGIAYDVTFPDGAAPPGGWPGVIFLHGLGGSKTDMEPVALPFLQAGYAVLAYTARGHGTSGGNVELASIREVQDEWAMYQLFRDLPEVSDAKIGAWGISYGGGQILNALKATIPYAAVEVVETWSDLYTALFPGNVAKSGIVLGFAKTIEARSPLIAANESDAVHSTNLPALQALLAPRSSLSVMPYVVTPVYWFQGRVDYAFDVAQATNAFARLLGPKKLYVGTFGHTPSTFPGSDVGYVMQQGVAWMDHYLKNAPNGIDAGPRVVLGSETKLRTFAGLPKTATVSLAPGARLPRAVTTWGGGTVTLQVTKQRDYPRLVAVVSANGKVVTHGAVVPHLGKNTIRLASYVVDLPKRARVTLRLGPDSGAADIAYLGFGDQGSIAYAKPRINLSVLK